MRRFAYFLCLCLLLCGCGNTGTAVSSAEIMVPTTAAEAEETKHTEQTALPEQTEAVDQVLDADTLVPVLDYLPELLVEPMALCLKYLRLSQLNMISNMD